MVTTHHFLAGLGLLGMITLAGCCDECGEARTTTRTACDDCDTTTRAVVHEAPCDDRYEDSNSRATITGQPISRDSTAAGSKDAQAGRGANRTGTDVQRISDVEIKNLSRDGNIWVGGEPSGKGYSQIHERGVTAVVDLRNSSAGQQASAEEARRLGMDYVNLPIDSKQMPPDQANAFLDFMRRHVGHQVLIHCGSANRASGMYAVYLGAVKGLSTEDSIGRAKQTGLREADLERDVRRYLDQRATQAQPTAVEP